MQAPDNRSNHKPSKEKQISFIVTEADELLKFLLAHMTGKSRNNIKSMLGRGQIAVDGKVTTQFNHLLKVGQEVTVNLAIVKEKKLGKGIKIIFEDQYLLVVEKQAGLLSIATDKEKEFTAYHILNDYVKQENPDNHIFIVHRLDRETSGVMMFAKSEEIQQMLQKSWKNVVTERNYLVVVEGFVEKEQDKITSWLKETKTLTVYSSHKPGDGQKAVTGYKVLRRNKNYSMLEAKLETGRRNQIRVHMQDIGHSVVGDKRYGATSNPIGRLGLHAQVLAFRHPITKEEMRFETKIPTEFMRLFSGE